MAQPLKTSPFLLGNSFARHLYQAFARDLPIVDYHCHLDPAIIANDGRFGDTVELGVAGDPYNLLGEWIDDDSTPNDEELLGCLNWLIDDQAASFVTGITVPVDGGFLASAGL